MIQRILHVNLSPLTHELIQIEVLNIIKSSNFELEKLHQQRLQAETLQKMITKINYV